MRLYEYELHELYVHFADRLGHVCIAGGAARDVQMFTRPKDIDLFVFFTPPDVIEKLLWDLAAVTLLPWHKSEPFLVKTVEWHGHVVQIMHTPHSTIEALVDSFDWNVCRFAYDRDGFHNFTPLDDIGAGKALKLHTVTFPLSTLRRGFRFSERFQMILDHTDIVRLAAMLVQQELRKELTKDGQATS